MGPVRALGQTPPALRCDATAHPHARRPPVPTRRNTCRTPSTSTRHCHPTVVLPTARWSSAVSRCDPNPHRPDPRFLPSRPRSAETSAHDHDRTAFRATFPVFAGETPNITVVTDLRSNKVEEIRSNPGGEFAWYSRVPRTVPLRGRPHGGEQGERGDAVEPLRGVETHVTRRSRAVRVAHAWVPTTRRGTGETGDQQADLRRAEESPLTLTRSRLCLVVMDVKEVDHLSLRATGGTCTSRTRRRVGYHRGEPREANGEMCASARRQKRDDGAIGYRPPGNAQQDRLLGRLHTAAGRARFS